MNLDVKIFTVLDLFEGKTKYKLDYFFSRMFQDIKVSEDLNSQFKEHLSHQPAKQNLADSVSIKILNVAAWARTTDKVPVTLPRELEDYIPEVEEFYKVSNCAFCYYTCGCLSISTTDGAAIALWQKLAISAHSFKTN